MKFTLLHFFAGIGGSALGCQRSVARFREHEATFATLKGFAMSSRSVWVEPAREGLAC